MALTVAELAAKLSLDDSQLRAGAARSRRALQDVGEGAEESARRGDDAFRSFSGTLATFAGGAAVLKFGKDVITAGAQAEQAVGGTQAVFGQAADTIDSFAKSSDQSLGLSEAAFRDLTTVAGAQLKNLGFSTQEAADQSIELAKIGADLAATYGGTTAEAVEALGAAFRGEADPAERFGLRLNITAANAKAVEMGLASSTSAVDDHARAQAVLALIMEQSGSAQGQFARESDTAAGAAQRLSAQWENTQADLGQKVLPVVTALAGVLSTTLSSGTASAGFALAGLGAAALVIIPKIADLREQFSGMSSGMSRMTKIAGAAGVAGAVFGIVGALDALDASQHAKEIGALAESFVSMGDDVTDEYKAFLQIVNTLGQMDDVFEELLATNVEAAERFVETAEAMGFAEEETAKWREEIERKRAADTQATADQQTYNEAITAGAEALDEGAAATEAAEKALADYSREVDDFLGKFLGVEEAQDNLITSLAAVNQHFADQRDELGAAGLALDGNSEAAARNREELRGLVEDGSQVIESMVEQGATSGEVRLEIERQKEQLRTLARRYGLNSEVVGNYIAILDNIPTAVSTAVTTSGLGAAIGQFDSLARSINNALRAANNFGSGPSGTHVSVGGGGGLILHEGGVVPGPRGQEIAAVLQSGERVLALDDPLNMALSGRVAASAAPAMHPAMAMAGSGDSTIHLIIEGTGILEGLRHETRVAAGGSAQILLGDS